jgi:hypothetical protein
VPNGRVRLSVLCALASVAVTAASGAFAASLSGGQVTLDARAEEGLRVAYEFTVDGAGDGPLVLYLASVVQLESASVDGRSADPSSRRVEGTDLRAWSLPSGGESARIALSGTIPPGERPGIRIGDGEGALLPGSGWFPSLEAEGAASLAHSTRFRLADGATGIACGSRVGSASLWQSASSGRPYAVWGSYESRREELGAQEAILHERGGSGDLLSEGLRRELPALTNALETALGPPCGEGPWKIVGVAEPGTHGGLRTLFVGPSPGGDVDAVLAVRRLSEAVAASYWTECVAPTGPLAAWLGRGVQAYLGDVTAVAVLGEDRPDRMDARVAASRHEALAREGNAPRSLTGFVPVSPGAADVLEGRAALVAHAAAEAVPPRTRWMHVLQRFRSETKAGATAGDFLTSVAKMLPNQHEFLAPLLSTTDLPAFEILSTGPGKGKRSGHLRVEVKNSGTATAPVEVTVFAKNGIPIRSTLLLLEPGQVRSVLMKDRSRIARVAVDPRLTMIRSGTGRESVDLSEGLADDNEEWVPSFAFSGTRDDMRVIRTVLSAVLGPVTLEGFTGHVLPYSTHHGPSGMSILGEGKVTITPRSPFAESWKKDMGRESLQYSAREVWVRFPVEDWSRIDPALGEMPDLKTRSRLLGLNRQIYQFSFPSYFYDDSRARVPPTGSVLVIFTTEGGERLGFLREELPDGRVYERFWNHLEGRTFWEETR